MMQKILIGKNIHLEPLAINHYELLRQAANDPRIWTYMPAKAHGSFYDAWFQECLMKQLSAAQLTYVIKRIDDNSLIGCRAYYDIDMVHQKLEIGYGWLTTAVWGVAGYNHESLFLLFQNAFETWKFNRIQIATDPRNTKNYNTLKKLGVIYEGILRQHMIHHNGDVTDTAVFSLLASEWPELKEKLQIRLNRVFQRANNLYSTRGLS